MGTSTSSRIHSGRLIAALAIAAGALFAPGAVGRDQQTAARHGTIPQHVPRLNRERPVVAVVAYNAATELTDFVVPYGILAESGVAQVFAVSTHKGPIQMSPALRFEAQSTVRAFDAQFPEGADYVIVPNVYEGASNPAMLDWVRQQAARGATIVGICDGVPVLANAGLLAGRRATGHWKSIDGLERKHRATQWLRNRRYVADGNVITTSGVSASIPIAVALVEAISGRAAAERVASKLGVTDWSPVHDSEQFKLNASALFTLFRNKAMFWRHEALGVPASTGVDEISIALIADAYGRTRRSPVLSIAHSEESVATRRGLTLIPDRIAARDPQPRRTLPLYESLPATQALDLALEGIAASYGRATADFVALTMEYPQKARP
jgi:putative intracellular protease/amidase